MADPAYMALVSLIEEHVPYLSKDSILAWGGVEFVTGSTIKMIYQSFYTMDYIRDENDDFQLHMTLKKEFQDPVDEFDDKFTRDYEATVPFEDISALELEGEESETSALLALALLDFAETPMITQLYITAVKQKYDKAA